MHGDDKTKYGSLRPIIDFVKDIIKLAWTSESTMDDCSQVKLATHTFIATKLRAQVHDLFAWSLIQLLQVWSTEPCMHELASSYKFDNQTHCKSKL